MPENHKIENIVHSFVPFLRRGLSQQIDEKDTLLEGGKEGIALKRAQIKVTGEFELQQEEISKTSKRKESIFIDIIGPGEVVGVQELVIKQVVPAEGVKNFESNFLAFIEFVEEDLPWRYTPVKANQNKLRPWLSLMVCKEEEFEIRTDNKGRTILSLKITDPEIYEEIFCNPAEIWKNAHIQFPNQAFSDDFSDEAIALLKEEVAFSRILSHRKLEENQAYTAFLIPSFETGRRSGLGLSYDEIPAQRAAWEVDFDHQKSNREQAFDFPVYYHWNFETSTGDFIELAKKINPVPTSDLPASLMVDVQNMGNGLNYSTLEKIPERKIIQIPVATKAPGFQETKFPARNDESEIAERMRDLLDQSPDLHRKKSKDVSFYKFDYRRKIQAGIETKSPEKNENEIDDPWIVPPLYGAKHIIAGSLEEKDNRNHPWFTEINLDVNHRAAAGLGKKVVQENQEQFVHRAWDQVEMIQELNQLLREHILKLKVNRTLFNDNFKRIDSPAKLVTRLHFMQNAFLGEDERTLKEDWHKHSFYSAYSSTVFQNLSSRKNLPYNTNAETLTDTVLGNLDFQKHEPVDLFKTKDILDLLTKYFNRINILHVLKHL